MGTSIRATSRDLAFLRLVLTSGVDLMTQMPLVSEVLKRLIPSFSLSMIRVDEQCIPQQHYSEFFDEFSHRLFAESGHLFSLHTDDPAAFRNLLHHPSPYGTLIDGSPRYLAGAIYQHLFQRNGIHHTLDVAMRDAQGPLAILGVFRERKAPAFTRADLVTVQQIYPYLVNAFRVSPRQFPHDEVQGAMVVLDAKGRVQWASAEAQAWLHDVCFGPERALLVDSHIVPKACRELVKRWQRHRTQKANSRCGVEVPEIALPIPGGRLRLRAHGLSRGLADGPQELVGVQIFPEVHRGLWVLRALDASPLTPQQQRIAYALWSGQRPPEICASMDIEPSTLKAYLKDLYRRLGVNSASGLVALLESQSRRSSFEIARHRPRT